jgi:hypothetical protein
MTEKDFCTGRWGSIVLACRRDGKSPAGDFLDALSVGDQAKMLALFRRAADVGWMNINNREKFKKIADGWYEFKSHQIRMPCYPNGHQLIVTHGFKKKKDDFPSSEISHAEMIKSEHEAIKNGGTMPPTLSKGKKR